MAESVPKSTLGELRFPWLVRRVAWLRAHRRAVLASALFLVVVVFALDLALPGYPLAGFYLVPLTLVAFVFRERFAALVAVLCLVLTLVVMVGQERTGVVELLLILVGCFTAIALISFARLQHQVERISRRAVMRAELAEATAGIIELSNSRADLDEVVQYTMERVGAEVGADAGILLLLREREWVGLAGYGRDADARGMRSPYERFVLGVEALESDVPMLVVDAAGDERVRADVVAGHHLGNLIVVPLRAFGENLGVIVLDRPVAAEPLKEEQLRFVSAVAGHAAVAIDNARLLNELEAKRHDLSLVVESGLSFSSSLDLADVLQAVVMRLVEVLQVDECDIYVLEDAGETVRRVASYGSSTLDSIGMKFIVAEYNMTAEAVATGQVFVVGHTDPRLGPKELAEMTADGHRSQVTVPLKVRDKVIGIIELYDRHEPRFFTEEKAALASAIAQSAALAIDNARLFGVEHRTTRRLQLLTTQLGALQEVALAVNQLVDPEAILDEVITKGSELLDAPHGAVVSRDGQAVRLQATVGEAVVAGGEGTLREDPWLARLPALLDDVRPSGQARASLPAGGRLLVVPLTPDPLGPGASLAFAREIAQAPFNDEDLALATTLGAHLSAGLERAIAYQREHEFADTFLTALLVKPPVMPGLDAAVGWEWATDLHHGGDFYDFVKLREGRLMVVIGDLAGKGYHQQAVIAMLRYMLRAYAAEGSPGESLSRLNAALLAQDVEPPLTTLVVGYLDIPTRLFQFAVAGHPRPLILGGRDEVPCSKSGSYPIGIFPTVYETNRVILPAEATVILYTDGFIDARSEKGFYGERRFLNAVRSSLDRPARVITTDLIDRVRRYARGDVRDDLAVVVLKLR